MSQGKCCCFANGGNPAASRNCVLPPLAWAALAAVLLGGPAAARAAVTLTDTASFASYWNTGGTQALGIPSFNVSSGADVLVVEVGMSDTSKERHPCPQLRQPKLDSRHSADKFSKW